MSATKPILHILDEVNVKFEGLDPMVRRDIVNALKFMVPYARHMPSFKLGRWDGKVGFATVGGATYVNLLDRVLPILEKAGIDPSRDLDIVDNRRSFLFPVEQTNEDGSVETVEKSLVSIFQERAATVDEELVADRVWQAGHPAEGDPIMLREHQVRAIKTYMENPHSVQEISTSAGKTIITGCLSMLCEEFGRTICIVPNKSLVVQTEQDYRNLGLDVGVFFGDRKEYGHKHTIATWQSLSLFAKKVKKEYDYSQMSDEFQKFIEGVVCVMLDEAHTGKANETLKLLTGPMANIPLRWGLTGTLPKEDFEFMALLSSLGPKVGEVKAIELQEKGILSNCHIDILQLDDSHVEFRDYAEEYDWMCTDRSRIGWVAEWITRTFTEGNTLILVERVETGEMLRDLLGVKFVDGSVKVKDRKAIYDAINDDTNTILVATYGVASTGINIPALHNVVLFAATKAFTKIIQSIGRGLRKSKLKDFVNIYDVCSNLKFAARHLSKRRGFYKEAGYPDSKKKVSYLS